MIRWRPAPILETGEALHLADEALPYRLRRSPRRRTLAVRVTDGAEVVVNVPQRAARAEIEGFLQRHLEWIRERRSEARDRNFVWAEGALLPFLGESRVLHSLPRPGKVQVWLEGDRLCCTAGAGALEAAVLAWYRKTARTVLETRLAAQCALARQPVPPMRLSNARTRWGSLSPQGVVSLNWRLVKAAPEVIDYVICHELAHFRQRNHSPAFWREVSALSPDWQALRHRLKQAGRGYFLF